MSASGWQFRDAGALANAAQLFLYANAALAGIGALLLFAGGVDDDGAAAALFGLLQLVVHVGGAIVFLIWLYRANANAHALGADDMVVSPGWSVGWYFVPLANLAMPFVAMRELWKASASPRDWQMGSAPATIPLWWACWIVANLAGMISFRLSLELDPETIPAVETLSLVSELFTIPAALLLTRIIAGIQAMQAHARGAAASAVFT